MSLNVFIEAFKVSGTATLLIFLLLIFLSIFTWGLIVAKSIQLSRQARNDQRFFRQFNQTSELKDLYNSATPHGSGLQKNYGLASLYFKIVQEIIFIETQIPNLNFVDPKMQTIKTNFDASIDRTLQGAINQERDRRERFFGVFATTSNIAPFVGLLGTVIGIINAFGEIGRMGNADLATVAPAISEALVATAFGLFVAIPASIAYNFFRIKSQNFREIYDRFSLAMLNRIQENYFFKEIEIQKKARKSKPDEK